MIIFFFIDDSGIYAFQDFSYKILFDYTEKIKNKEKILKEENGFCFNFVFKIDVKKLNEYSYFLLAFYFLEKLLDIDLVKIVFIFCKDKSFEEFVEENKYNFDNSQCFISANFNNSKFFYSKIRNIVPKRSVVFL